VGQKVQTIRTDLQAVEAELASETQRFDALKLAAAQAAQTYHESTSHIALRLQVGTTPANPELVDDWNQAQGALDTLSQTIDGLNALTTTIQSNAAHAQNDRDAIKAASATSGGVDDDRTQLAKLQAETDQTLSAIDRLNADVSQEARRQGGYLSSERAGQVALQAAITSGDASGVAPAPAPAPAAPAPADAAAPAPATAPPPVRYSEPTGAPIATVVFDKPKVAFEQSLYASLNQALAGHPNISFTVVAVAPVAKTTEAMITAQTDAQHHAQEVVHAMTSMGVPAGRIAISSSTDPTVSTSQVRVFGH
jgi:ribosomal protein L17